MASSVWDVAVALWLLVLRVQPKPLCLGQLGSTKGVQLVMGLEAGWFDGKP